MAIPVRTSCGRVRLTHTFTSWEGLKRGMNGSLHWDVFVSTQTHVVTTDLSPGATASRWSWSPRFISGRQDAVLVDTFITVYFRQGRGVRNEDNGCRVFQ